MGVQQVLLVVVSALLLAACAQPAQIPAQELAAEAAPSTEPEPITPAAEPVETSAEPEIVEAPAELAEPETVPAVESSETEQYLEIAQQQLQTGGYFFLTKDELNGEVAVSMWNDSIRYTSWYWNDPHASAWFLDNTTKSLERLRGKDYIDCTGCSVNFLSAPKSYVPITEIWTLDGGKTHQACVFVDWEFYGDPAENCRKVFHIYYGDYNYFANYEDLFPNYFYDKDDFNESAHEPVHNLTVSDMPKLPQDWLREYAGKTPITINTGYTYKNKDSERTYRVDELVFENPDGTNTVLSVHAAYKMPLLVQVINGTTIVEEHVFKYFTTFKPKEGDDQFAGWFRG